LNFRKRLTHLIASSRAALDCVYWFLSGPPRERGFQVVAKADRNGLLRNVKVTELQVMRGHWKFSS
jgi:hypothetical protein